MTHVDNIPHILEFGITHRYSQKANPNYTSIGDFSLIGSRNTKIVNVSNGLDNNHENENVLIGDFIPFYFGLRTPMLYVIQKGGNFVPQKTAPDDIIYCVSSVQKIIDSGMIFYFTDGHATNNLTTFFNSDKVSEIETLVDLKAVNLKYWNHDYDLDLKRRKEAEFLVKDDVPNSCVLGYICYSEAVRAKLLALGINEKQVVVRKNYYF